MDALTLIPLLLAQALHAGEPIPPPPQPCELPEHVVLVSIDGFRPDFYLNDRWPAPMLRRMATEGLWSEGSETVFPSVTYPSHTTLVTGVPPVRHGILYNRPEDLTGPADQQYFWADSIRVPALWDLARADGRTVAGFWWPATIGAEMDVNLPVPPLAGPEQTRLDLLRGVVRPAGLIERMEREVTGPLTDAGFRNGTLQKERYLREIAREVIRKTRPHLLLYHVLATDAYQHEHGPDHSTVRAAVAAADSAIATLVRAYKEAGLLDRTTFVITGDHGFAAYDHGIAPNIWLKEAGFLSPDATGTPRARFVTGGGYAFLLLRDEDDHEVVAAVRSAIRGLAPGDRDRFEVVELAKAREWGADARARLVLSARPGNRFEARVTGPPVAPVERPGGTHGHRPDLPELRTGFLVWGAGIRPGQADSVHALHVNPLIARLLRLPTDPGWASPEWLDRAVCAG